MVLKKLGKQFEKSCVQVQKLLKVMVTGGVISANDRPEYPQFTPEELKVIVEEAGYRNLQVVAHAHGKQGINKCC